MPLEPLGSRSVRPCTKTPAPCCWRGWGGRASVAALAGAWLALGGCALGENFGDLGQQLLDPEVQGIETPGERWVDGAHYDLNILADEHGKRYAFALNADSELVIIDFMSESFCRAGKVLRYDSAVAYRSQRALVPLLVEQPAPAGGEPEVVLTFTTFDCQRTAFGVPVRSLPLRLITRLPSGSGAALLLKAADGGLLLVDPWAESATIVAGLVRDVDPQPAFGRFLWVDGGVIVISDERLEPLAAFGSQVSTVTASPEDAQLAYVEAEPDAQAGTLYTVDARGWQEPRQIATDACVYGYLSLDGRRKLAYLSPCAERRLVLRDVTDDTERVVDSGVAGPPAVRSIAGRQLLTYVTTPSRDVAEGTLWAVDGQGGKVAIAENTRIGPSAVREDGSLLTVVDWAATGGRLLEWRGDAVTEVARGVVELNSMGRMANDDLTLLGNFDGTTGDLLRLRNDLSTEVLASGVPPRAANDDAFVANYDGDTGELLLLDREDGSTEPLATGVGRGAFIFTQQFNSIMMLADRDAETRTNTLRFHLLRSKRQYALHAGVTEAREVAFPNPGILYNVIEGADAGIWFAKAL